MTVIKSAGTGGYGTAVDSEGFIQARAVSISVSEHVNEEGNAYNINTGVIALTSTTESAVLYFKNLEDSDFAIDYFAIGIDDSGTTSAMSTITLVKNPTAGTIVSGATDVSMNENRNFGSSNELTNSIAYKGAEANTFTDGSDYAIFYQSSGARGFYQINTMLKKGNSIGVKIDTNTTAGTTNVYVAMVGHLRENLST